MSEEPELLLEIKFHINPGSTTMHITHQAEAWRHKGLLARNPDFFFEVRSLRVRQMQVGNIPILYLRGIDSHRDNEPFVSFVDEKKAEEWCEKALSTLQQLGAVHGQILVGEDFTIQVLSRGRE